MAFKDYLANRESSFAKLNESLEKLKKPSYADDDRYWQPTVDKANNGYALIRFLPPVETENVPYVQLWSHSFQSKSTGLYYIENCLTTLGENDPVSEYNNMLWNSTTDDNSPARKQARDQKRKLTYISNILVIKDPGDPANEGKVFLYKFGAKVFSKINDMMFPTIPTKKKINPFDLLEGANFNLVIVEKDKYRNYDKSEFESSTPITKDMKVLEEIYNSIHPLQPLVARDQFKSYDQLKNRFEKVLGNKKGVPSKAEVRESSSSIDDMIPHMMSGAGTSDLDDADMKLFASLSDD